MCTAFDDLTNVLDCAADDCPASSEKAREEVVEVGGSVDRERCERDTCLRTWDERVLGKKLVLCAMTLDIR